MQENYLSATYPCWITEPRAYRFPSGASEGLAKPLTLLTPKGGTE